MSKLVRMVEAHYDSFPYPTVTDVAHPVPREFKRGVLNYLLRRRADRIQPQARIWIAGCGTQQAAHWALCFPDAEIVASDISAQAIDIAAGLVRSLGLENVQFEKRDLMAAGFSERFDLVVSTGVLYHLPDPAAGLSNLKAALLPGGALYLMVYSQMHRHPVVHFRQALSLLAPDSQTAPDALAFASRLLQAQLSSETCAPPGAVVLGELLSRRDSDPSYLADALLHPLEHSYDIDGLLDLLSGAGLKHVGWLYPGQWRPDAYLSAPELLARADALDPVSRWKAVYYLAGHASPSLAFLAEPQDAKERPPFELEELLEMPILCGRGTQLYPKGQDAPARGSFQPAYEMRGDEIHGVSREGFGISRHWSLPAEVKPIFDACDGQRTLGDLLQAFSGDFDEQELFELFRFMLPDNLGLLAPAW